MHAHMHVMELTLRSLCACNALPCAREMPDEVGTESAWSRDKSASLETRCVRIRCTCLCIMDVCFNIDILERERPSFWELKKTSITRFSCNICLFYMRAYIHIHIYIHFFLPVYATKQDAWIYMYIRTFQDVDN